MTTWSYLIASIGILLALGQAFIDPPRYYENPRNKAKLTPQVFCDSWYPLASAEDTVRDRNVFMAYLDAPDRYDPRTGELIFNPMPVTPATDQNNKNTECRNGGLIDTATVFSRGIFFLLSAGLLAVLLQYSTRRT